MLAGRHPTAPFLTSSVAVPNSPLRRCCRSLRTGESVTGSSAAAVASTIGMRFSAIEKARFALILMRTCCGYRPAAICNPEAAREKAAALLNGYLEELCDALFLDFLERADSSWHEGTLEELAGVKYGKNHKKLADGPYPVYGSGGFMRSAEKSLFSGESVLIPRKGSLNNVMYVNEAFWTVDTMFFTVPRIPGAAKFLYQYVKRLDLASMNSGSTVPSMTTSILNALSLPVPPRDSLLSFNAKLQSMYDAVRANNLENRRLESLRDSLLPKLMTGEIDVSKIDLTQLNSHLA